MGQIPESKGVAAHSTNSSMHSELRRARLHSSITSKIGKGVAESLTWAQLYRLSLNVALELKGCGSTGDRAVILAPQGLDYIVAFLGALEAGLIAVPLSVPGCVQQSGVRVGLIIGSGV